MAFNLQDIFGGVTAAAKEAGNVLVQNQIDALRRRGQKSPTSQPVDKSRPDGGAGSPPSDSGHAPSSPILIKIGQAEAAAGISTPMVLAVGVALVILVLVMGRKG